LEIEFFLTLAYLTARYGFQPLKQAIAGGQNDYPLGLFYTGQDMESGPRLIYDWFKENVVDIEQMVVVDIHTGLGPFGYDSLLVPHDADEEDEFYTQYLDDHVEFIHDASGTAYIAKGNFDSYFKKLYPNSHVRTLTQEFGTIKPTLVLKALREENYFFNHVSDLPRTHWSKINLKNAFYPDSDSWKESIISRGEKVFFDCIQYLQDR